VSWGSLGVAWGCFGEVEVGKGGKSVIWEGSDATFTGGGGDMMEKLGQSRQERGESIMHFKFKTINFPMKIHSQYVTSDFNPDNDMITPTNTPTKKSISEIQLCVIEVNDDFSVQLSSNKFNKVIKKEKLA
ncbi:hypothetical protein HAX54_021595, partial [Datura stramonium]|nr:hypothetical protein [Datura stramonium]